VVWCGVVWCGVVWCGVVWCGVVWCGVVWCGVCLCCVLCGGGGGVCVYACVSALCSSSSPRLIENFWLVRYTNIINVKIVALRLFCGLRVKF
jgi:hypothetical protein